MGAECHGQFEAQASGKAQGSKEFFSIGVPRAKTQVFAHGD